MTRQLLTSPVRAAAALLALLMAVAMLAVPSLQALAQAQAGSRLTNLEHLDFLATRVDPPAAARHDTYQLSERPSVGALWTYAEPRDDGTYERIGGGEYDPETNTYGQGAYNADDIARAAVVYLRHWQQFGDDHSRDQAFGLLRGLTYLQTTSGPNRGNVVLWMQPDGTLNPSAEPPELPDPSDSGPSYWLARTIWALGEGYAAFAETDPDFAAFLQERLELAIGAVRRQVLDPNYGTWQTVDGLRWPAWLIADGADASSEAIYGLSAYVDAGGDAGARRTLRRLAEGVAAMQQGDAQTWPFGALMPWAQSRSVWHAWGDQMAGALAEAGQTLDHEGWVSTAVGETARFTPHLLAQGGPENGWLPAPTDGNQIAYGADATLQNLVRTADATHRGGFRELAGIAAAWYFGNNPAGEPMYDPSTGRTFDGVSATGDINRNSGAESTIHGLLSMLQLDQRPGIAADARIAERTSHVSWQLVEAEDGELAGDAEVMTPESAWTGESLWSSGGYVALGRRGRVTMDVDLPVRDRYVIMPVFKHQEREAFWPLTLHRLDGTWAGLQRHGGAGAQGITAMSGYLDIGSLRTRRSVAAGPTTTTARAFAAAEPALLDALLVQPRVEWLLLRDAEDGIAQGVLRSFAARVQHRQVQLDADGLIVARAYDQHGRRQATAVGEDGEVRAPVWPGGFTVVSG
ncbi:MAG: hypothetical protein ACR2MA_11125 [Egibacteraceae bacterium]